MTGPCTRRAIRHPTHSQSDLSTIGAFSAVDQLGATIEISVSGFAASSGT